MQTAMDKNTNQCIDCFFRCENTADEPDGEMCYLDPDNPVEINYFDPACKHFELCEEAEAERKKQAGKL